MKCSTCPLNDTCPYYSETKRPDIWLCSFYYAFTIKLVGTDYYNEIKKIDRKTSPEFSLQDVNKEWKRLMSELHKIKEELTNERNEVLPPIVSTYSFAEFVEMAFDINTPTKTAIKYQKAIKKATVKGKTKNLFFTVPFQPSTGRIKFINR
jgi:hypothetical protein